MPKEFAPLYLSTHQDADFLALTHTAQWVYQMALSASPDLSNVGVMPYLPRRIAKLSRDMTERKATTALGELSEGRFIVIDRDTEELLVRAHIRRGKILKVPNMTKSMNSAYLLVHSDPIKQVIRDELKRAIEEAKGQGLAAGVAKAIAEGFGKPLLEGKG